MKRESVITLTDTFESHAQVTEGAIEQPSYFRVNQPRTVRSDGNRVKRRRSPNSRGGCLVPGTMGMTATPKSTT